MPIILRDHKIHYKTLFPLRTRNIYLSHICTRPPSTLRHQKCRTTQHVPTYGILLLLIQSQTARPSKDHADYLDKVNRLKRGLLCLLRSYNKEMYMKYSNPTHFTWVKVGTGVWLCIEGSTIQSLLQFTTVPTCSSNVLFSTVVHNRH